jgi:hypothetical protein
MYILSSRGFFTSPSRNWAVYGRVLLHKHTLAENPLPKSAIYCPFCGRKIRDCPMEHEDQPRDHYIICYPHNQQGETDSTASKRLKRAQIGRPGLSCVG